MADSRSNFDRFLPFSGDKRRHRGESEISAEHFPNCVKSLVLKSGAPGRSPSIEYNVKAMTYQPAEDGLQQCRVATMATRSWARLAHLLTSRAGLRPPYGSSYCHRRHLLRIRSGVLPACLERRRQGTYSHDRTCQVMSRGCGY